MDMNSEIEKFVKSFTTLKIEILKEKKILHVQLNRPNQLNAINEVLFTELGKLFSNLDQITNPVDIRVIILSGNGKSFCSGLDLTSSIAQNLIETKSRTDKDIGRKAYYLYYMIKKLQESLTAMDECTLPIISAIHGYCLGGAMSIATCTDVKIATKDSKFSIKEIDIGITADIGLLQRIVKQCGREGIIKRLSYTGEIFSGEDAYKYGIIEELAESKEDVMKKAFELAEKIVVKSPLVLWGIKRMINFSRDHPVKTSLDMVATMNSGLLLTDDIQSSIEGFLTKKKPMYPKL